jgi:Saf4/Yju2 protein
MVWRRPRFFHGDGSLDSWKMGNKVRVSVWSSSITPASKQRQLANRLYIIMGERKVLNKYIPADFDPSLVPRGKKLSAKDGTVPVRMMLPFSVQCDNCHTFLYRGRKFNSKKEAMGGPDGKYLGITRWRFYIKCTHCSRPLTFLTDPKNADYEMESGGTRNYEIQKDKVATEDQISAEIEREEQEDPMKALENRVLESKSEMADLDNLEEIKAMNARHVKLLATGKLPHMKEEADPTEIELTAEDEALVKSIQFGKRPRNDVLLRLDETDELLQEERRRKEILELEQRQLQLAAKVSSQQSKPPMPVLQRKRKVETLSNTAPSKTSNNQDPSRAENLSSLLAGYDSDST